ncbi:hypothetical protein [Bradyrhizobium sp. BR 1432]|uniref:hypothetical protein n=1 Tax=Bradyrhizobium sp. BR 1432 TaxID=3447966 RepID=UPI003EE5B0EA
MGLGVVLARLAQQIQKDSRTELRPLSNSADEAFSSLRGLDQAVFAKKKIDALDQFDRSRQLPAP